MKIYVTHSSSFDYQNELYKPLRESDLNNQHQIFLPHEEQAEPVSSKILIQEVDIMLAEVSFPSTGQGIELGWADAFGTKVIFLHKKDHKYSSSIKIISDDIFEYDDSADLISVLSGLLSS